MSTSTANRRKRFDAVIVGSGASGGWAAKKLTEAGLNVALIEAGPPLIPERDYTDHVAAFQTPHRGLVIPKKLLEDQPVQSNSYAYSAYNHHLFVRDSQNPYVTPKEQPFHWIRSRQMGGRTTTWGRVCVRLGDIDFKAASRDGHGVDWPLQYRDIEPYYDEVEQFIGINGTAMTLAHQPDGKYLPAMKLSCGELLLQKVLRARFGRTLVIAPSAILTEDRPGRAKCHYCGPCERGCITRSFFSTVHSTLPPAMATGRLTVFPNTVVREIQLGKDGRAQTVACIDALTRRERALEGRVILLAASTLESTRILLNSKSSTFPAGLGNASGVLGHYLMDHTAVAIGARYLPQLRGVWDSDGHRPTPFYIPRFQNLDDARGTFLRGFGFEGAAHDTGRLGHAYAFAGFGAKLKQALQEPQPGWYLNLISFGECLAYPDNQVSLDPVTKDAWGMPALRIEMRFRENEEAMAKAMLASGLEMMDLVGGTGPQPTFVGPGAARAVHEVGTARMGTNPKESFLNGWNQSHEVKNLFVLDGAAFSSLPCQNPTLTIMALAARACDYIVAELKRAEL